MKYVKLEHRLSIRMGKIAITYVKFDTNDENFEDKADDLWHNCYNKQESKLIELRNTLNIENQKVTQTKEKIHELKGFKFSLKNWFSKDRKAEINKLKKEYDTYTDNRRKIMDKIRIYENTKHFDKEYYHELSALLKNSKYCLISKTTDNNDVTTELWHKY